MFRTHALAAPARLSPLPAQVRARVRRPGEIQEATRWLFAVLALVSIMLSLPAPLAAANGARLLVVLASSVVLGLSWGAGYLRRSAPFALDVVDAVAIAAFALASPEPVVAMGIVFAALWFRSLYGSGGRAVLRCALYAGALSAVPPLWPYVLGHTAGTELVTLLGAFPTMFLTVIVARHLTAILAARARSARLDAVHVSVGSQLLGVIDAVEIRRIAWAANAQICAAIPGLRVLKLDRDGATLRVDGATGGFVGLPATLPAAVLSVHGDDGTGSPTIQSHTELDGAVGIACAWACVPMPDVHQEHGRAWLLLGSPRTVPAEALVAVGSLADQVTLALRNSEVHRELSVQATLDSLTGLANRMSFNSALSTEVEMGAAGETTVLFVDLDDFKDVNDVFGHRAGDDLLCEVAARLREATRPEDLCARLGGDEFAVLLRGTGAGAAAKVAQRIVELVAAPAQVDGGVAYVGASVGVATSQGETNVEQLIHRADVAMYAAKASGKGRIQVFEAGLLPGDTAQVSFERQLAAAARNGELVVHYQPVLSLPDGQCTAVEALVRWQHPQRGLLYPADFIEIAERTGAIHSIGAHVLRRACADATTWRDDHPSAPLAIHVNISALQLDDEHFIDSVLRCLKDFTLPANQLVLEVTETVVISSPTAIEQLNALAAHGIVIAIDDFGTGYSALTTLRSLPAQIVKIDRSFVAGSTENAQDLAVTEAVVTLATKMGLRTIAEGVETLDQQRLLEEIGADDVQGYLYLRPTTAENFGIWLSGHLAGRTTIEPATAVVIPFGVRPSA
ncbi:MAG TPA: EAL domain-containing protein [Dermatophilaceae bacterium]